MAIEQDISAEDRLSDIACIYNAIDACIRSFYAVSGENTKSARNTSYGLMMAIERLNDEVGRHAGVI